MTRLPPTVISTTERRLDREAVEAAGVVLDEGGSFRGEGRAGHPVDAGRGEQRSELGAAQVGDEGGEVAAAGGGAEGLGGHGSKYGTRALASQGALTCDCSTCTPDEPAEGPPDR